MSIFLQAFRVGETVVLADQVSLDELQTRFSDRNIAVPNMSRFAGRRVRIKFASTTDGYQFDEVEGRWMEDAIVDPCLQPKIQATDTISYAPANQAYVARADNAEAPGYVSIVDTGDELFLRFRSSRPDCDAQIINRIAGIRCRIAFEINLGFHPRYSAKQP